MKVLLINDSTTSSNWGDRAAAVSLMAMIRQRGGQITHAITQGDLWNSRFGSSCGNAPPGSPARGCARDLARLPRAATRGGR